MKALYILLVALAGKYLLYKLYSRILNICVP